MKIDPANFHVEDQKIAAFGSSYRGTHSNAGAAEGCDLLDIKPAGQS
ncbi:TPA: hypothetical protein SAN82_001291 [Pseudomonas putida]|nr:hypothetical protein [Pseudomonas putida]